MPKNPKANTEYPFKEGNTMSIPMNTREICEHCKEMYVDHVAKGNGKIQFPDTILYTIIHFYNHTEIDYEEVYWLWQQYMETGNLYLKEAIEMARKRIQEQQDIRETEEELIHWLHRGVC
jgi:hypothetical protein